MLPNGVKLLWGFIGLYVGLILFILTNALIYFRYDGVPTATPADPFMYLGIVLMVVVPLWFWVARPLILHLVQRSRGEEPA